MNVKDGTERDQPASSALAAISVSSASSTTGPRSLRSGLPESCRRTRNALPLDLLDELDEESSFVLDQHLSQCSSCLSAYIALQTASTLACLGR